MLHRYDNAPTDHTTARMFLRTPIKAFGDISSEIMKSLPDLPLLYPLRAREIGFLFSLVRASYQLFRPQRSAMAPILTG